MPELAAITDTIATLLTDVMVPGQIPLEIANPNFKIVARNDKASNLLGRAISTDLGSVTLPTDLANSTTVLKVKVRVLCFRV